MEVALDRPFGHPEMDGNVGDRPVLLMVEQDDLALLFAQAK